MTVNAAPGESQVAYHVRRANDLKQVRSPWEYIYGELARFIEPTRWRPTEEPEGWTSRKAILDTTATMAWRTLKSGMHSGITSPARPWFKIKTADPDLNKWGPVKEYLETGQDRMREVFAGSNLYSQFHIGYGDMGQFGQSAALLVEDDKNILRVIQCVHGEFWLGRDASGRCNTLYRRFTWPVHRIVQRFGTATLPRQIREAFDQARYQDRYTIWHAVEPRMNRDPNRIDRKNKPYLSNYWIDGADSKVNESLLIEESGFDENPIIAPGWEISGDDTYSVSPGMIALGEVKMLMKQQKDKLDGIEKQVKPPMTGPTSMKGNPASILPGSITYSDDATGAGYRAAFQVNWDLSNLTLDIREVQQRCEKAFYADLFLMLANMEGIQPRNQFELSERKEEKLLALGPVLENIFNDQLDPTIDRAWNIMNRRRLLPPPPQEIARMGGPLEVEYTSMLAQAQKAQATGSIERMWAFAGQISAVKPEVLDVLKGDETIEAYADMVGYPSVAIATEDEREEIRQQRAQQMQQQQQVENAPAVAGAAKSGADAAAVMAGINQNPTGGGLLQQLGIG